jgi:hypothetical protein
MTVSAPGWYPNPNDPRITRFWTGAQWAGERIWNGSAWVDAAPVPPSAPAPAVPTFAAGPPYQVAGISAPPAYYAPLAQSAPVSSKRPVPQPVRNRLLLTLGGAALMIIGVLLPSPTQDNGLTTTTIHGTDRGGGETTIVIALVIAVLAALFLNGTIGRRSSIATLLLGALAISISIGNMSNISDAMDQEKAQSADLVNSGGGTHFGAGLFVVFVGCALVLVGSFMTLVSARKGRTG